MLNVMVLRRKGVGHALSRPDVFAERVGQLSVLCFVKCFVKLCHLRLQKQFLCYVETRDMRALLALIVDDPAKVTHFTPSVGTV